ncbi:error-prone DNA polymerase [Roseomonas sp. 18066]|uniref:error-prone DNA polymerase n=1 Tax=Roseomonas sp. 18066 TaxID=2681412 RepID=UPI001F1EF10C|nr:error-prone DNA polymerase [Roseomonas sp. 18066]
MTYVEVAARSNFSFLDGASHPDELVRTAAAHGHPGIGLCDLNGLPGVVRGHSAAKEVSKEGQEIGFMPGCRLRLLDGSEWLAWPADRAGYGALTALLSAGRMEAPKGECHVTLEQMVAAAGESPGGWALAAVPPAKPDDSFAKRLKLVARALRRRLVMPLFLYASCPFAGDDAERLDRLAALAERAGARLLAGNDIRYHAAGRRRLADLLTAIRLRTTVDALGLAAEPNAERRLKSPAAMARLFARHPRAIAATLELFQATRGFSLDQLRYEYPDEVLDPGLDAQQSLARRVEAAIAERWPGGIVADLRRRLTHELRLIGELGYAPYFLTVHEIVRFARSRVPPILCQGRGSAANSAVCYVLGITAVDPAEHDLLFERFVSASRGEPPDIDIDFEHERREEVIQHLYERYGRGRAAICATLIRYRARSAIRETGRAMGLSEDVTARLAKASWGPGREMSMEELAAEEKLDLSDPRLAMTLQLAGELLDFPRHTATHVGGFVITRGPLVRLAVVGKAAMEKRTVLEWDKDDIDALGILKVDVLGLGMLSCLRRGFDLLRRHHGRDLDLASLPKECPATYGMLQRADSLGVFQVESRAQMNMLPRLRPEKFYDLVVQVAIVRPGPIQGDMVHPYLRRRQKLEKVTFPGPKGGNQQEIYDVLHRTEGVPLFQEQAMRLAIVAAGFSPEEADQLRRAMASFRADGSIERYREKLVGGMVGRGYEEDFALRVFEQIRGFSSYGFPESHAASFAKLVYASAWMKCHHPGIFACALLNSQPMGFYAPAQIIRDAREHGVQTRPVDINASHWDCAMEDVAGSADGLALRLGLRLVRGLAEEDAARILDARRARNGAPFAGVEELAWRAGLGRGALVALAGADGFAGVGAGRRRAAWDARGLGSGPRGNSLGELPLFSAAHAGGVLSGEAPLLPEPQSPLPEEDEGEAIVEDYVATGLTLRRHPLALLRPTLQGLGCADMRALQHARHGSRLRIAGLVLMRQRPGSAKGIIFLTLEDEHGEANLVVYTDVAARDRAALVGSRLLLAEGRVEREDAHSAVPIIHLLVGRLEDRTALLDGLMLGETADGTRRWDPGWADRNLGPGDEVRHGGPPASRGETPPQRRGPDGARLPRSRDFR